MDVKLDRLDLGIGGWGAAPSIARCCQQHTPREDAIDTKVATDRHQGVVDFATTFWCSRDRHSGCFKRIFKRQE
jgi:hypothetical protein